MIIVWTFLGIYLLWVFYLAVMNLDRAKRSGTLGPVAFALGLPILIGGLALDFLINLVPCTIAFRELPRELTVTARLKKHIDDKGHKGDMARWIADHLLDPFDPSGKHV